MFSDCSSLKSLPDISKWNTINVTNMKEIFSSCTSLRVLPDLSKWKTLNVNDMSGIFFSIVLFYLLYQIYQSGILL